MEKITREIFERPFDRKYIKTRRGTRGTDLPYLEGAQYIQRMNDATDGQWSYSIIDRFTLERPQSKGRVITDLVVLVEVRAFGEVRQAFGGAISPAGECLGDDWKSALTDALKKAIASYGVALDLYCKGELCREDLDGDMAEAVPRSKAQAAEPVQRPKAPAPDRVAPAADKRQLEGVKASATALGWTEQVLDEHCLRFYKVDADHLSKAAAAELLGDLVKANAGAITGWQIKQLGSLMKALEWSKKQMSAAAGGKSSDQLSFEEARELIESLEAKLPKPKAKAA